METLEIITTRNFNGVPLNVYGDFEEPLFMARDIAEMIDYSKTSQGYYDTQSMLRVVEEDEKIKAIPKKSTSTEILRSGLEDTTINYRRGAQVWFLTEQGLYEVLFQSRKPKAKEFKGWVKEVLKEIRLNGYYMQGELVEPPTDDIAYIKSKLRDLQQADSLVDIHYGMQRINEVIRALVNPVKKY